MVWQWKLVRATRATPHFVTTTVPQWSAALRPQGSYHVPTPHPLDHRLSLARLDRQAKLRLTQLGRASVGRYRPEQPDLLGVHHSLQLAQHDVVDLVGVTQRDHRLPLVVALRDANEIDDIVLRELQAVMDAEEVRLLGPVPTD